MLLQTYFPFKFIEPEFVIIARLLGKDLPKLKKLELSDEHLEMLFFFK